MAGRDLRSGHESDLPPLIPGAGAGRARVTNLAQGIQK